MAKTETTVKSYVYTVTSPNGGTVTDAAGKLNKTVDAGDQVTVTAPSDSLTCDDDDAVICKVNFKNALAALSLLGGGDKLPAGYTRVDFLESNGTQYIETDFYFNNSQCRIDFQQIVFRYDQHQCMWLFGARCGLEATCMWGIWSNYEDSAELGWCVENGWTYGLQREAFPIQDMTKRMVWHSDAQGLVICGLRPTWRNYSTLTGEEPNVPYRIFGLARVSGAYVNYGCRIWSLEEFQNNKSVHKFIPALSPAGEPCMYDIVSKQPFRNSGTGPFIAGVKDAAQLRTVLRRLPATGGSLKLSLPAEANTPDVADMLQACYDTKGWTITVHEYRPAAAATYSLRRVREVVWCSREQSVLGSYVDPTGTRWQIDRCAAIFGPHGQDPTAYGYEPFDSVEQAVAAWGLVPYVDPEAIAEAMGDNGTLEQGDTENTSPATNS